MKSTVAMVRDKTKKDAYMCCTLLLMFKRGDLRKNHPQQRKADKWKNDARDGFITTVIKQEDVDSIKICEQIIGDKVILWLIDGLQRLTNLEKFKKGLFKLGRNIELPIIHYQKVITDTNGNTTTDENGDPIKETIEYDLRGKGYNDLPDELKERFDNYQIDVVKHLNCTDEEIGYHIRRYNRQSSMNNNETTVTYMDHIAKKVKQVSQDHSFFKNCGSYTKVERNNGTMERIVCESLMAMFYLDKWQKNGKKVGAYLNENVTNIEFDILNEEMHRLENIIGEEYKEYFTSKDTFIFFSVFHEFAQFGLEDARFGDFLNALRNGLHSRELDVCEGFSFDKINENRATKDKSVVQRKLNILVALMKEYFGIQDDKEMNIADFVCESVGIIIEDVQKDIDFYEKSLENLLDRTVKINSDLRDKENWPSLLAIMAYSYKEDVDIEDWLTEYAVNNNRYFKDQRENYLHMKKDLEKYLTKKGAAA